MWRAGLVQASEYDAEASARGSARGTPSPALSVRSGRSNASSALTETRRAKLMELLSEQNAAPKRKVERKKQRSHRGPRVRKGHDELRKAAMERSRRARAKHREREARRDEKMGISRSTGSLGLGRTSAQGTRTTQQSSRKDTRKTLHRNQSEGSVAFRNDAAASGSEQFNLKHSQDESSRRGVTVVLPEAVFFNGMNCIERPHWSVVNSGMANGEDQTLSLSMWLSPSSSLRLKRGDIGLSDAARLKSSLSLQAAAGQGELSVSPGGGTRNASDGDWYVVVNRQRASGDNNPVVQAINRMLDADDHQHHQQSEYNNGTVNCNADQEGRPSGGYMQAPTINALAQHQIDAAILGADFSISGASTPQLCIDGRTGALKVTAMYRNPSDINNSSNGSAVGEQKLAERSFLSVAKCPFGKWTHVVIVICGSTVRLYMDGSLDSQMFLPGPVHMPREASLYIGRMLPVQASETGYTNSTKINAKRSAPSSLLSDKGAGAPGSTPHKLGFVGFLAHAIVHSRALDKLGIEAMAGAPRPALPREQDEWSALSKYESERDRQAKIDMRRQKIMRQREARRVLDEQVAYNRRMRAKAREDEMAADRKHLSKYGAMADQLKYQQREEAFLKQEKARKELEAQRAVQAERDRAIQERQMADEIHEVRLLQMQVQKHRQDEEAARARAIEQAKREAREYRELILQREVEKERKRRQAIAEREAAEREAEKYRAQMTARETARRRKHREYRDALDAQIDLKYSSRTGTSHLSPAERSLNKGMLAKMATLDAGKHNDDTSSQWNGSQYSVSYGGNPVVRSTSHQTSPIGGSSHVMAAGMRSGPRGLSSGRTGIVTRAEISALLDE